MDARPDVEGIEKAYLEAAERLIGRKSFDRITVRDLASEAGVSRGSLHYHFGSVSGLLEAAAERFLARLLEQIRDGYRQAGRPAENYSRVVSLLDGPERETFAAISSRSTRQKDSSVMRDFVASWERLLAEEFSSVDARKASVLVALTLGWWLRATYVDSSPVASLDQAAEAILDT